MENNAKKELYNCVDWLRNYYFGAPYSGGPVDVLGLCGRIPNVTIYKRHFETVGFCGAAIAGIKMNTIILNSARSEIEQNFDCGHELIHLSMHRGQNDGVFQCFGSNQNTFLEWQANEGAAQLLVPYQDFIPRFADCISVGETALHGAPAFFAEHYHVSQQVINLRIKNLSYEIDQFCCGTRVEDIKLLSRNQLNIRDIHPTDYLAKCAFALSWDSVIGWD